MFGQTRRGWQFRLDFPLRGGDGSGILRDVIGMGRRRVLSSSLDPVEWSAPRTMSLGIGPHAEVYGASSRYVGLSLSVFCKLEKEIET